MKRELVWSKGKQRGGKEKENYVKEVLEKDGKDEMDKLLEVTRKKTKPGTE